MNNKKIGNEVYEYELTKDAMLKDQEAISTKTTLNDIHSELNATEVARVETPESLGDIQQIVRNARQEGKSISIAGSRHSMGGQQFGTGTEHVDTRMLNRILNFDDTSGVIEVEAGIQWTELIEEYLKMQAGSTIQWGIRQKQTGANQFTLGGSLAANVHGRALKMRPFISDIESFVLVDANGDVRECDRKQNRELFGLVIGGYGLFGIVYSIRLRLTPRFKVERIVEMRNVDTLADAFQGRIDDGFEYGDFQFATDETSDDFLTRGVFSCYRPVASDTPVPDGQITLSDEEWAGLLHLGHVNKPAAYRLYSEHYLSTSGQVYWSDLHQMNTYLEGYHESIDEKMGAHDKASEMISELYVPRARLADFMTAVKRDFVENDVNVIYGTIRLIERDDESFLPWARDSYASIIFNLHTVHTDEGLRHSADAFRRLIDIAIEMNGSYYLTYHRYARKDQVEACYPWFREFLDRKLVYDPDEVFQSDWYRHYSGMFETSHGAS